MHLRRLLIVQLIVAMMIALMLGKMWLIQEKGHVPASLRQRKQEIVLDSGRGHFYDRNHRPLTGFVYPSLVVFPHAESPPPEDDSLRTLLAILGVGAAEWHQFVAGLTQPEWWPDPSGRLPVRLTREEATAINGLHVPHVAVAPYTSRYLPDAPASQLIGYLGQNPDIIRQRYGKELAEGRLSLSSVIGVAGLESVFEPVIRSSGAVTLAQWLDGADGARPGLRLLNERKKDHGPVQIVTTLDLDMQREVERLMERHGVRSGAVVVLDAQSADVLVMASRPSFDPRRPDMTGEAWSNKALKAFAPGSVFKTVIAAAALESGKAPRDETHVCTGEYGKYGLSCWKRGGHGRLHWSEAFAVSCNTAFASLAERLSGAEIERMAGRLGLVGPIGWSSPRDDAGKLRKGKASPIQRQFDHEEGGRVFAPGTSGEDGGVKVQTAIGQRDVRVTPLALANMVVTIVNDGEAREPRVVTSIRFRGGAPSMDFPEHVRGRAISKATALQLKGWMRQTVKEGTGLSLLGARWPLAGKSGTAQVPRADGWGENEWFVGFGPADHPRYVAAVLVQKDQADDGHTATRMFKELMDMAAMQTVSGNTGSAVPFWKWR